MNGEQEEPTVRNSSELQGGHSSPASSVSGCRCRAPRGQQGLPRCVDAPCRHCTSTPPCPNGRILFSKDSKLQPSRVVSVHSPDPWKSRFHLYYSWVGWPPTTSGHWHAFLVSGSGTSLGWLFQPSCRQIWLHGAERLAHVQLQSGPWERPSLL